MRSLLKSILVLGALLCSRIYAAEANTTDQKIDSLLVGQQILIDAVVEEDVVAHKQHAITFNLPLFIATAGREERYLSAGYHWFPPRTQFEIVLPIWQSQRREDDFSAFLLDLQARYYFNDKRHGYYVLGGLRHVWMEGREEWSNIWWIDEPIDLPPLEKKTRLGVYSGIGWRAKSDHIYWGYNIVLGRYFGANPDLEGDNMLGEEVLFDVEFFKFGWLF